MQLFLNERHSFLLLFSKFHTNIICIILSFAFLCKLSSSRLNKSNSNCILFTSSFHSFISCPSQLYLRRLFKKNRIILLHSTLQRGGSLPVSETRSGRKGTHYTGAMHFCRLACISIVAHGIHELKKKQI